MSSYVKGIYSYLRPGTEANNNNETTEDDSSTKDKPVPQPGYVKSVASGIYNIGSGTVGVGVNGVKWIAGTTYNATSTVVCGAGSVASAVGSGASSVVTGAASAVVSATKGTGKEHKD